MLKLTTMLLIVTSVLGCSGADGAVTPTAPSTVGASPQSVAPLATTVQLRGFVTDTAFRAIAGARIEVLDGPSAGYVAVSGDSGEFVLSGMLTAATQFRATKEGHQTRTQPWNCSVAVCLGTGGAQPWLGFYLTVLEASVNIAGDYTLTFTAAGTCTDLPDIARTRSYRAAVTARPADGRSAIPGFDLKVIGPVVGNMTGFPIGVAGNRLNLWLHARHDPPVVEDLGGNTYLAFSGGAETTVATSGMNPISAAFDGWIEHVVLTSPLGLWYWPQQATSKATCDSSNHRVTLIRLNLTNRASAGVHVRSSGAAGSRIGAQVGRWVRETQLKRVTGSKRPGTT